MLLSSLGGAAITSVRIEGVAHEFSTIPGVKEDVTDIVLNLKDIVVRMHTDADEVEAPLVATGPGEIKAKDIDLPSGVEILNPEAPIATLEKKTKLEVYLTIGRGRGYSPGRGEQVGRAADRRDPDRLDLLAGPARRLRRRAGPRRSADRLRQTDARHRDRRLDRPARGAARGLRDPDHELAIFTDAERVEELSARPGRCAARPGRRSAGAGGARRRAAANGLDEILIEELELGVRSYNCLKRAGVQTVGDLVSKSRGELNAIPNFGQKSIEEVIETLHARGLGLREG